MQKVGATLPQSSVIRIQDGAQGERPRNMSVLGVYTSLLSNLSEFIFPLMCVGFFQTQSERGVEFLSPLFLFPEGGILELVKEPFFPLPAPAHPSPPPSR